MPPRLALMLCSAFVMFLLRLEWRGSRGVSPTQWIPTLWMLVIASKPLAIWFDVSPRDNEGGSGLDQLLLAGLSVAGMIVLNRRRFDWLGALRRHGWLMALLAYMFVSTIWSDITFIALRRWVREVIVVIMALVVMSEVNPHRALESVLRRFAYVLIPFSLVVIKYYPALGVDYGRWSGVRMWSGVAIEKNNFGCLCSISAFFLLWALSRRWRERSPAGGRYQGWADISVLLIALFLLSSADKNSATAAASLAVGGVTFLSLRLFRKLKLMIPQAALLALVISVIGFGIAAPFLGGSNIATFSSSLGRDESLTGRTEVWAQLVPVVERQPLLGSGFGSFWTTARRQLYEISDGHNGYLDILLDLGVVGFAFYFAWLLSCAWKLHDALTRDYHWASMGICFLLMALVYNATESTLSGLVHQMTALVVMFSLVVPYKRISVRRSYPNQHTAFERGPKRQCVG